MSRPSKDRKTRRLTLDLPETVRVRLEVMRDELKADSLTEVVKRALAFYDYSLKAKQAGSTILIGKTAVEFF